jgi:DNA-binding transcriptional regulator YiaG|tara:strand:+ start:371 stop:712 length:342 start_codon:yes stop_codon:yes gene_type:complete
METKPRTLVTPRECARQIEAVLNKFNNYSEEDNEKIFNTVIGLKMRQRRLDLGFTQTKISRMLKVTFQQIQKYERGINQISSLKLWKFCELTETDFFWFFESFKEFKLTNGRG